MPIKNLRFSFDVPITSLLGLIATGNAGLKIDVFGDDRVKGTPRLAGRNGAKLIEGPKQTRNETTHARATNGQASWLMMLEAMARNPEHTKATSDLGKLLEDHGLSARSVSPQLTMMQKKGFCTRIDQGVYRLTAKGLREAAKRNFKVANADHPVKKRRAKRKSPPAATAAVAAEADHG